MTGTATITVMVNGEPIVLPAGQTVGQLLNDRGLDSKYLAVELNRRVIPRGEHAHTQLAAGDQVEIVTLVGGG